MGGGRERGNKTVIEILRILLVIDATQIPFLIKTILKNGHKMVCVPVVPKPVLSFCLVY